MAIPPARASTVPQPPPARAGECCDRWERGLGRETPWGLPQCIQLSSTFSFMWSWTPGGTGLDLSIIHLEKTGSCPQGASRSHQAGQVRPPPRGRVRCERWQEVQEDSGGPGQCTLPTWKGWVSPLPSTVLAAAAALATVSGLSPSLLLLPKN